MSEIWGWDIGGAHLKLARLGGHAILDVRQLPCPLWQGADRLTAALEQAAAGRMATLHAVTMTGELADIFPDRATGVRTILAALRGALRGGIAVYGASGAFLGIDEAAAAPQRVASANWHAAAHLVAARSEDGLFVDIGSTTTDLVPLRAGRVVARGISDAERLALDELVYAGVVRTPIMAVARRVFIGAERIGVMAEHFATMADVYRLTGELPPDADQMPTADGRGKSPAESRARLARMVGRDAADAADGVWDDLARQLAARQLRRLERAAERVLSASALPPSAPVIGAGVGRFAAKALAQRLQRPYRSFADLVPAPDCAERAADCAPAVAVALLMRS